MCSCAAGHRGACGVLTQAMCRPLGGRHAAVIPALPDGQEQEEQSNGGAAPANGSTMSVISMGATPSPQPTPEGDGKELRIIHVDASEGNVPAPGPHPMASIMDRTPMKSITFHQEAPTDRPGRTRRPSTHSHASDDYEDRAGSSVPRAPSRTLSHPHLPAHPHSPGLPPRTASHSPALHREPYSPHAYHDRAYASASAAPPPPGHAHSPAPPTPQQQQVPAPFASILNAYNTEPRSPDSPYEPTPLNGGVSRLRGAGTAAAAAAMER